jgi:hypothetical protein
VLGSNEGAPDPNFITVYGDAPLEDAWYSLEEMIVWARTLDERMKRSADDHRRYPDQGLIPALADGPRRQAVINAWARVRNDYMKEVRRFANLSLHAHSTEPGTKGQAAVRGGGLVLRFLIDPLSL